MFRWLRRLRRLSHARLSLPPDLDLAGLLALRLFLHRTTRIGQPGGRVKLNREEVVVETSGHRTLECRSLPRVLDAVALDAVKIVTLEIHTARHRVVSMTWRADGAGDVVMRGKNPIWVKGMSGVLDEFLREGRYKSPQPQGASWRRRASIVSLRRFKFWSGDDGLGVRLWSGTIREQVIATLIATAAITFAGMTASRLF